MEYIVIGLMTVIIIILGVKNPNDTANTIISKVVESVVANKDKIATGIYEKLPKEAKDNLTEEQLKAVTDVLTNITIEVIEDNLKLKK